VCVDVVDEVARMIDDAESKGQAPDLAILERLLKSATFLGDSKLNISQGIQDNMENKCRTLELDKKNYGEQ
jgi:hypothetical protein